MELFVMGSDSRVELDKEWISTVPQFEELVKLDKGSPGDYRGTYKLLAKKWLTYVYHMADVTSPLDLFPAEERKRKALEYSQLNDEEYTRVVDQLTAAIDEYNVIQEYRSATLTIYRAAVLGNEKLATYIKNIDFNKADKQGKLLFTPQQYVAMMGSIGKAAKELASLKKAVLDELTNNKGIRGNSTKGINEDAPVLAGVWDESK